MLRAPPPTPCLSPKQKSGSVPDMRIADFPNKEKSHHAGVCDTRNITPISPVKPVWKNVIELNVKKSNSDHGFSTVNSKPCNWVGYNSIPCTSNLLHSVRQKLLML